MEPDAPHFFLPAPDGAEDFRAMRELGRLIPGVLCPCRGRLQRATLLPRVASAKRRLTRGYTPAPLRGEEALRDLCPRASRGLLYESGLGLRDAGFFMLGATAEKSFIDIAPHLTGGVVQYRVKAQRGQDESEWTANLAFDISGGSGVGILGYVEPPSTQSQAA